MAEPHFLETIAVWWIFRVMGQSPPLAMDQVLSERGDAGATGVLVAIEVLDN
jgi:hypothetical protein